jgi:hypothetical protein
MRRAGKVTPALDRAAFYRALIEGRARGRSASVALLAAVVLSGLALIFARRSFLASRTGRIAWPILSQDEVSAMFKKDALPESAEPSIGVLPVDGQNGSDGLQPGKPAAENPES